MPRILLIEGEPDLADFIAGTLHRAGHEVCVTSDGAKALQSLRFAAPDLVITEMVLSDIVGLSLCENLRNGRAAADPHIPVIITSTCAESAARPLALEAGAHDFLQKPFSAYQLMLSVHSALEHAARERFAATCSA